MGHFRTRLAVCAASPVPFVVLVAYADALLTYIVGHAQRTEARASGLMSMTGRLTSALFLLAILTLGGCQNPGRFQASSSDVSLMR
jgi:hypothetical protein